MKKYELTADAPMSVGINAGDQWYRIDGDIVCMCTLHAYGLASCACPDDIGCHLPASRRKAEKLQRLLRDAQQDS